MNNSHAATIRFKLDDLRLFSAASHDRNPLHVSSEYARRSSYGQQVVFGILGVFACLGRIEPPLNCSVSRIRLEFRQAMFLNIDYPVIISQQESRSTSVRLCDGSTTLLKADFTFAETDPREPAWGEIRETNPQIRSDPNEQEFTKGVITRGEYLPDQSALTELLSRFAIKERAFGRLQLSALLWSSYLVGMEQPGLRALFHKLTLAFESVKQRHTARLSYEAKVISLNALGSLCSELRLYSGDQLVARGESRAFVIPRNRIGSVSEVEALLPGSDQLRGKVALVVGASRGLGAMLTTGLALQGCSVLANFNRSETEAHRLRESLAKAAGRVVLAKGDAGDLAWCLELEARVVSEFGRLDFLICAACPPLLPLRLEPETVERINSYVGKALALISVPMSVFSKLIGEKSGWSVVISSIAVETTPKEWPHYVAAKWAIEGLVRVAALQYPNANFLLVRPSRLRTDLTNGPSNVPFGQVHTMLPEIAAAKIVQRLQGPTTSRIEVFIP